jgi:branched-chain amino acid transport system permease protein
MTGEDEDHPETVLEVIFDSDATLIVGLMLALYALFLVLGVIAGNPLNGLFGALQQLTFLVIVYALAVLALDLHWGYTGLFNIGVAGFMAIGTYSFAMLTSAPSAPVPGLGIPVWIALPIAVFIAAMSGLLAALPAMRLRADYLAIVTIGLSEIIRYTFLTTRFQTFTLFTRVGFIPEVQLGTGGARGIAVAQADEFLVTGNPIVEPIYDVFLSVLTPFGIVQSNVQEFVYVLVLLVVLGGFYVFVNRTTASPFGRVLKAIREDEDATRALGKDTQLFKIKIFLVGCGLMGLVGILWQGRLGFVEPNSFRPRVTFFIFIALIVGGPGSTTGSILGSAFFVGFLFRGPIIVSSIVSNQVDIQSAPPTIAGAVGDLFAGDIVPLIAYVIGATSALRLVLMGFVLILFMKYRPDGLLGHRKITASSIDVTGSRPDTGGDSNE